MSRPLSTSDVTDCGMICWCFSEIDECQDVTLHSCLKQNHVVCKNLIGGYQCVCVDNNFMQLESKRCVGKIPLPMSQNSGFHNGL